MGLYCVQFSTQPAEAKFMITIGGNSQTGNYTRFTDPNLAVAPGFTSTASGVSDVGGANSLITLGLWGDRDHPRPTDTRSWCWRYVHA